MTFLSMEVLTFAYPEYFCTTLRALALGRRLLILHRYLLRVLDIHLLPTLHTVCLRHGTSFEAFSKDTASCS